MIRRDRLATEQTTLLSLFQKSHFPHLFKRIIHILETHPCRESSDFDFLNPIAGGLGGVHENHNDKPTALKSKNRVELPRSPPSVLRAMNREIRIATRGSELALWQTNWVRGELENRFPEARFETLTIKTTGDKILDVPLAKIGDKGLFTKELDSSLLRGETDFAVHSLKDLPTKLPNGLAIAAITKRRDARDVLISRNGEDLASLRQGARVATGSLRRRSQLLHHRPDLEILEIRGNLNTRFRKFDESDWDAMILAAAGVERLGWDSRISEKISTDILLPAVGQGSLAILCREEDLEMREFLSCMEDQESMLAAQAERSLMRTLEGGCQVPIGAQAVVSEAGISLAGCVCSLDGRTLVRDSVSTETHDDPEKLGALLAGKLLENGAREILRGIFGKDSR